MKMNLKSDSGYSLGLVLIFVLAVATVLGSVLTVTQLSADAQGRGVDQIQAANNIADASANVLEQITKQAATNTANTCSFEAEDHDVRVSCQVVNNSDGSSEDHVIFTASNGSTSEKRFMINPGLTASDPQRVTESHD
jgi:hypothetical protein